MRLLVIFAAVLATIGTTAAGGQSLSGESLALSLRSNVVKIVAQGSDGTKREGFGFVVGQDAGQIYIVTANHVVRGSSPDEIAKSPTVLFFGDQGKPYPAELLGTRLANGQGDLAILRARPPPGFTWIRNALAPAPATRDAPVWFVGKQGEWYVPARPGAVNDIEPTGTIRVEGLPVTPGTSGGPLIGRTGIVGMVVAQSDISEATPLDVIKRAVDDWHYPWNLENAKAPESANQTQSVPVHVGASRLAVLASLGNGAVASDLSRFESQLGGSILAGGRYTLVDRTKLAAVFDEQRFSHSANVDPKTAARLGKIVGASMILVTKVAVDVQIEPGEFATQIDATTSGDYQLLDVSTATVLKSGSCDGTGNEKTTVGGNVAPLQKKARIEALDSCAQTLADQLGQ